MDKRSTLAVMVAVLLCVAGSTAFAIDALLPTGSTPLQVVVVRKAAMQAISASVGDARAKLTAGTVKVISANGRALIALAAATPALLGDTYSSVYPVGTSKIYFKGGAAGDVQKGAQALVSAAEDLVKFADADDKAGVEAQLPKVQATCGACHGQFRGQLP